MFLPVISLSLLLCCLLTSKPPRWKLTPKHKALAFLLFILFGLREQMVWRYPEYFMVPKSLVKSVTQTQEKCGPHKTQKYFLAWDLDLVWTLPARTQCKNLILFGQDPKLHDEKIAARYMAVMLASGFAPSKDVFLNDWENHLDALGSPQRELSRNLVRYSPMTRMYQHTVWYLFLIGNNLPERREYLHALMRKADYTEELHFIQKLDQEGEILKIN